MLKNSKLLIIGLSFTMMFSCQHNHLKENLQSFLNSTIDMGNLENQITNATYNKDAAWRLIIYNDSTECSSCRIREIGEWTPMVNALKAQNVETIFIFNPTEEKKEVIEYILKAKLRETNILIDKSGEFKKKNPKLPHNALFHIFLIDKNGTVVVVGNPLKNKKVLDLMLNTIDYH